MNPLIFYRISKPAKNLDKLPLINLASYFKQKADDEQICFNILKSEISEAERNSVVVTDKELIQKLKSVRNMSFEQD